MSKHTDPGAYTFVPRHYCALGSTDALSPADLATLSYALAGFLDMGRDDLADWYRALGLALFGAFGLSGLRQRAAVAEARHGAELRLALGVVEEPDWDDALGRAWDLRDRLLALPDFGAGTIEGHPFRLTFPGTLPADVQPLADAAADGLFAHSHQALALTPKLDRTILALWGCPVERLDAQVTVAALAAAGLEVQTFED